MRARSRSALRACARALLSCAGLLGACAVYLGVDYEERLTLLYIGALLEEHLLEVALDTGTDFDELLRTYAAHVFAVDIHIGLTHLLYVDHRHCRRRVAGAE